MVDHLRLTRSSTAGISGVHPSIAVPAEANEEPLSQQGNQLRTIIDTIPTLAWSARTDGTSEFFNRRWLDYTGLSEQDALAGRWAETVHPEDLGRLLHAWHTARASGEPFETEVRHRRFDSVYRWFLVRGSPLRDEHGRIEKWVGTNTDIEDRRRAEEALGSMQARLSRAAHLATVSEVSASIAHEINQPLAAVMANGQACRQWLVADPPNIERALRSADLVVRDANFAAEIVKCIRSLFKQAPFVKDALDMNDVIEQVCQLMTDDLSARGVALVKDLQVGSVRVIADRLQIQQVLANLVRNGMEAMEAVTDRPKQLIISSRLDGDECVVLVTDCGVGIDDADAVFESLYSTKLGGLGMGLAICRSIIHSHGGRLWADRNACCGSTFGFALRVEAGESP